jgi:hypothetical protein
VLPHTDEKCRHPFATSRTAAKLAAPLPSATPRTRMPGCRRAQHNAAAGEPHLRRKRHRNIWCWLEKHLWARTAPSLFTHPGKPLKLLTSSPPSERTTSKNKPCFCWVFGSAARTLSVRRNRCFRVRPRPFVHDSHDSRLRLFVRGTRGERDLKGLQSRELGKAVRGAGRE